MRSALFVVAGLLFVAPAALAQPVYQEVKPRPRAGLELSLHAHDVCAGLGVAYEPDADLARRLRDHTADWPMWTTAFGGPIGRTDDPWGDLLCASGRHR